MKPALLLAFAALAACSTVRSRMSEPPLFAFVTERPASAFNECFVGATGNENVSYLPRVNGGTFKASAGPQNYVFWLVTVDDLTDRRRISVQAVNSGIGRKVAAKVRGCLD